MTKINGLKFELFPRALYSPDLTPLDVNSMVDVYLQELDSSHFKQYMETIEHSWEKCI